MARYTRQRIEEMKRILAEDGIDNSNNPMYSIILDMALKQDKLEELNESSISRPNEIVPKINWIIDGTKALYRNGKILIYYIEDTRKRSGQIEELIKSYENGVANGDVRSIDESIDGIDYILDDIANDTKKTMDNKGQTRSIRGINPVGEAKTKFFEPGETYKLLESSGTPKIGQQQGGVPFPEYTEPVQQVHYEPLKYSQQQQQPLPKNKIRELSEEKKKNHEGFMKKYKKSIAITGLLIAGLIVCKGALNTERGTVEGLKIIQGEMPPTIEQQATQEMGSPYTIISDEKGNETIKVAVEPQKEVIKPVIKQQKGTREQINQRSFSYYIDKMDETTMASIVSELKYTYSHIRGQNMQSVKNMALGIQDKASDKEYLTQVFSKLDESISNDPNIISPWAYADTVKAITGGILKSSVAKSYGNNNYEDVSFYTYFRSDGGLKSVDVRYPDENRVIAGIGRDGSSNCNKDMQNLLKSYLQLENSLEEDPGISINNILINDGAKACYEDAIKLLSGDKTIVSHKNGKGLDIKDGIEYER